MIKNIHERFLHAPTSEVGALIDQLSSPGDVFWHRDVWPPMRFAEGLKVGASGGHGPIRYRIEEYERGRRILFRFTAPKGFLGTHGFDVEEIEPGVVRLRHTLSMRAEGRARVSWPLVFRWLHDALIEDALDRAEASVMSKPVKQRTWSRWVKLLRSLLGSRQLKRDSKSRSRVASRA